MQVDNSNNNKKEKGKGKNKLSCGCLSQKLPTLVRVQNMRTVPYSTCLMSSLLVTKIYPLQTLGTSYLRSTIYQVPTEANQTVIRSVCSDRAHGRQGEGDKETRTDSVAEANATLALFFFFPLFFSGKSETARKRRES